MSKISVVLFYWITIMLALVFAKVIGIADNTTALVVLLAIVTLLYIITTKRQMSIGAKENARTGNKSVKQYNSSSQGGKKKKNRHK